MAATSIAPRPEHRAEAGGWPLAAPRLGGIRPAYHTPLRAFDALDASDPPIWVQAGPVPIMAMPLQIRLICALALTC
jgi:hypothetical protein